MRFVLITFPFCFADRGFYEDWISSGHRLIWPVHLTLMRCLSTVGLSLFGRAPVQVEQARAQLPLASCVRNDDYIVPVSTASRHIRHLPSVCRSPR